MSYTATAANLAARTRNIAAANAANAARRRSPAQRFFDKVVLGPGGCWLWTGAKKDEGYGVLSVDGRLVRAHRWAYEFFVGPIPPGLFLDHACRVPACCNPFPPHACEPVTNAENGRRGIKGVLTTHCPHGHPYDAENTRYEAGNNHRHCRACDGGGRPVR